jgi:PAS domain S-box-containing protein
MERFRSRGAGGVIGNDGDGGVIRWGTESNPIASTGRRHIVLLIALGFAAAASILVSGWQLWQSRGDEVSLAIRNTQNLTALLSENLSRVVSSVDPLLMEMAQDDDLAFTKPGWDAKEAHEHLKGHLGAFPMIQSFFIIGKDGTTVTDTRTFPPQPMDSLDSDYFRALMDPASPSLHIGSPIENRHNGTWLLPIVRRIVDANGSFNGIIGAGLKLTYFQELFSSLQVGPGGSISIVHRDGWLVVRSPDVAGSNGRPLSEPALFQEHLSQAPSGIFDLSSVIDGVPRFFSYQTVPGTPLIVVIGIARAYVLAGWYTNLKTYGMAVSACCAAIIVLTILLVRNQVRRNELASNALKVFRRFHTVFDGSADGLVAMDSSGRVLSMNPAATRMFGCSPGHLDPLTIGHLIPGLAWPNASVNRSVAEGTTEAIAAGSHVELEGRALDGRAFPLDLRLNEIIEDGERIIVGSMRDLTERDKAAEALGEAEARFQLLTENINIVPYTFAYQGGGRLDYVGPQAERLFGYPIQAWSDPSFWRDHVHPDDAEAAVAEERKHLRSNSDSYEMEYRMIAADGRVVWIRDLVRIVTTDDTGKTGFGAFIDISDTKQRDQRLAQVQRMEAVGQLTGGLAHDLNNALTVIIGNLEMTSDGVRGSERLLKATALALKGARRSADIVRRLLAFARQQPLHPREVDLNRLIHSMTELLTRSLGEELELEAALAPDLWPVIVDPFQLEDALLNLVFNARDAMPRGGKILIETANVAPDERIASDDADLDHDQFVMIAVSDTGVGMRPEVLERAFEPFFTTKEVGQGSGLGLSAVFGFAQQSGGQVRIESEPGRGTIVRLYLRRATAAAHADPAGDSRPRGSERVLVVEDDALVREFVVSQLAGLGYEVVQASNAPAALDIVVASNSGINLLFSDIAMPGGMNGAELAKLAVQRRPGLKILLTSGYSDTSNADAIAALGLTVLSKPYSWDQLAIAVREALDRTGGRDA